MNEESGLRIAVIEAGIAGLTSVRTIFQEE